MTSTLWIDVDDLLDYLNHKTKLTGIQRLVFEACQALQQGYGDAGRVRFLRHDALRNSFQSVPWETIAAEVAGMSRRTPAMPGDSTGFLAEIGEQATPGESRARILARKLIWRLSPEVRRRLIGTVRLNMQAIQANARLAVLVGKAVVGRIRAAIAWAKRSQTGHPTDALDFAAVVKPGDVLASFGAPWSHPNYAALVEDAKRRFDLKFMLLLYDIIPLRRPEWVDRNFARHFNAWLRAILPQTDVVMSISQSAARDVEQFAAQNGISPAPSVRVIPIGTGFSAQLPGTARASDRVPPAGSYVLFVSTIEPRKNHLLAFRVWRRMLDEMPAQDVPMLVFAGRVGWMVDDLMRQLINCDFLDGKIRVLQNADDAELAALYRGCLFTVFPSLYEGWGLPVTESLAFGKPCIASNSSSIPEAGGKLCRYFDPDSVSDAYAVIRATLADREGVRAWQEEVARSFVPVPWSATAAAIMTLLDSATSPAS